MSVVYMIDSLQGVGDFMAYATYNIRHKYANNCPF